MTKADLISVISAKTGMNKVTAGKTLDAFIATIQDTLKAEKRVALSGFGTLVVEKRQARTGRNPRTGQAMNIPASNVVKFRPSKALKDIVR